MDIWTLFITAFIVGFSGALMPGPLLAVTIAESPKRGMKTGPILVGGHAIAELAVIIVLMLGLAALAENKAIANGIGIVGGAMLIFMGVGMLYDLYRSKIKAESAHEQAGKSNSRLVADGIITSLSNPYWYVWWATTGSAFLIKSMDNGMIGPPVFYVGHILSDLVWYSIVSILIWNGRKLIVGTGYKILISICALFLLYLGTTFIMDGARGIG
ncbi:MAG: LysE family transporter [Candidatus Zixiibacteriota bacterium]